MQNRLEKSWCTTGFVILCIRFVQGFIFWGGGSRRFIYAPEKLDPHAAQWLANKIQSAMPGALLGTGQIINFLLQHFTLLYVFIILFSLTELIFGMALMLGCLTRLASVITACLSLALMLIFGWEGATCLDEWTMAVATLSMALTLMLSGSPLYSIDGWLMQRYPNLVERKWFLLFASGPLSLQCLKKASLICFIFTFFFTLITYNYYRGAIFSAYHPGPVSATQFHLLLSDGQVSADGSIQFTAYVNAGNSSVPTYIIRIDLLNAKDMIVKEWSGRELSLLPNEEIKNAYPYNKFSAGDYGIVAPMSAKAQITLPKACESQKACENNRLQVYLIDGQRFILTLKGSNTKPHPEEYPQAVP